MPDPAVLTELGQAMLAQLPPPLRGSYEYMAVANAVSKEVALVEAAVEIVRSQFNPGTADVLLDAWEFQLRLPVGGSGADIPTRRQRIFARLRKALGGGEGFEWEQTITEIVGPGWSYLEHDPADPSSPADGIIQITVPFPSGSSSFLDAQTQIRDITDAHLEIEFVSTATFELDVSQLDENEFGA
jgi:hypothetical protein